MQLLRGERDFTLAAGGHASVGIHSLPAQAGPKLQDLPLPADDGEESEEVLSDEDLEFVQTNKARIGFLAALNKEALDK